jgi:hypothetical protein
MSPGCSLSKLYLLLRWSPICTPFLCRSLTGATKWAAVALWAEIRSQWKLLAPRPKKSKNLTRFFLKQTRSVRRSNVWAIQRYRYQKTYLEISWDYPFKYQSLLMARVQWVMSFVTSRWVLSLSRLILQNWSTLTFIRFLLPSPRILIP